MKSRAETCREKADECERAAARVSDPQIQASYRKMSRQWHEMADRQLAIDKALTGAGTARLPHSATHVVPPEAEPSLPT